MLMFTIEREGKNPIHSLHKADVYILLVFTLHCYWYMGLVYIIHTWGQHTKFWRCKEPV